MDQVTIELVQMLPAEKRFAIIASQLEVVRKMICPSGGIGPCACKYGLGYGTRIRTSEKTGCPELKELISIYKNAAQGSQGA